MSALQERDPLTTAITVTEAARAVVLAARASERDAEDLALFVEVNGANNGSYTYDIWFQAKKDTAPSDVVVDDGELTVVVIAASVDKVLGATLDVKDDGLVIVNPNTPPQAKGLEVPGSDLSSPIELGIMRVLEDEINPQIAQHGGHADLVAVANNVAYLRLSGGCQGCAMSQATLTQGIAVAIKEAYPEIVDIIDVTAHADGDNPYYDAHQH